MWKDVRGVVSSPTCITSRTTSGVLCPVLASPVKKKKPKKTYRVSLVERHQNDDGLESYVCFKSSKYLIRL